MMQNENQTPIHFNVDSVKFCMFTNEQLKKLCVTKITTPLSVDSLGHPLAGGLCDKLMGPLTDKSDPCGTCRKIFKDCPGHLGYIELPLPVVNPIFHKLIGTILRISCLSCYQFQIPNHIKYTICLQIKLLNCGLVTEALEIQSRVTDLVSTYETFENIPEEAIAPIKLYELQIAAHAHVKVTRNKNVERLRNNFVNGVIKQVNAQRKVCIYCKAPMDRIQALSTKIIRSCRAANSKAYTSNYVTPEESRNYLRQIYTAEKELMCEIVSVLGEIHGENPIDVFYMDLLPVIPPNARPVNIVQGRTVDHTQTNLYKSIIQNCIMLRVIVKVIKNGGSETELPTEAKAAYTFYEGKTALEKLNNAWEALQTEVNAVMDSSRVRFNSEAYGLKQIIEKKDGIIRMHMMGKRVNYACRSVITPDPNLSIDEIGIPEEFAKILTYPVPVTSWNVEELRKLIKNGPNIHPGAVLVEYENGMIHRINADDKQQQESLQKCLLTPENVEFRGVKRVHRHLCTGDVMLLNRQPTLHKPSIMAHTARILKGEKTLRLHYANCKAYNADFDGDEMNAHFPQNELARSEGYNVVSVAEQYLVPKDGTPLSGLIQDHMIAGVRLSIRGRFFTRTDYQQLVYQALSFKSTRIQLLPPAIVKPAQLWSGKQILSTIIINTIPEGEELISLEAEAKIKARAWQRGPVRKWKVGKKFRDEKEMSEAQVVIRNGELLCGVLDKVHYGATPYGLIHCIYELYGGKYAIRLLSAFAKLFTRFLQQEGFTLGVRDILTTRRSDKERKDIVEETRLIGKDVMRKALGLAEEATLDEIVETIQVQGVNDVKLRSVIDREYKSALDAQTNRINKSCLPAGLICKFPENNLQLMVQSGAKGSTVNTMQISCLLGQIELEGKRPPVMICGKSLPSFPLFEFAPRAGGFIDGRFMTGIQPQEFFFHCMAGREGLIDTAVKTSRSGYLQRCLIKHLEGLTIGYDQTVRDSDKSVVQFLYGEDGMDISNVQFLKNSTQINFLNRNAKAILGDRVALDLLKSDEDQELVKKYEKKLKKWKEENGSALDKVRTSAFAKFSEFVKMKLIKSGSRDGFKTDKIVRAWQKADETIKENFQQQCTRCPDPLNAHFQSDHHFGVINERIEHLMEQHANTLATKKEQKRFRTMLKLKSMQSLCAPGEPVGLLAAQSIGEPSTQMTLNTFHFAGRGEMNVTLGIPRLREILMMASKVIKTPSIEVPFKQNLENLDERAELLRKRLTKVVVSNVLERIDVEVELVLKPVRQHKYTVRFEFLPLALYEAEYNVRPKMVLKHMSKKFFGEMFSAIRKFTKINSSVLLMDEEKVAKKKKEGDEDDEEGGGGREESGGNLSGEESDAEEVEDGEDAKMMNKFNERNDDGEPEEEEVEKSDDEELNEEGVEENEDENERDDEESAVIGNYHFAQDYTYDKKKHLWCQLTFALPMNFKKLDLNAILKEVANKSILWQIPHINRAITYVKDNELLLRTDGINILEMFKHHELLDLNRLCTNDIHKMAEIYGIEAAMKIIVKEVKDVFNVYGIQVDPRHLSLIADYMTFNGTFEPLSRKGMESSASPLQQMSFESSLTFLKNAVISGKSDPLLNPSSCLMIGKPVKTGTGGFTLMHKVA